MQKDDLIKIINNLDIAIEEKDDLISMLGKEGLTAPFLAEFKYIIDNLQKKLGAEYAEEIKVQQKIYEDAENELQKAYEDFEKAQKNIEEKAKQNYKQASKKIDEVDLQQVRKSLI